MESQEATLENDVLNEESSKFEGRWNRLISSTNWEKGQIIHEWRDALKEAKAPATDYSDEAWAQRVGGVTGQHVGRLRRVYERFGGTANQYEGLYWSHFQAALDWDDAEMWLEGGIHNGWSVAKMRKARWEAIGAPEDLKPKDEDIITSEADEDLDVREDHEPEIVDATVEKIEAPGDSASSGSGETSGPDLSEGPDFGEDSGSVSSTDSTSSANAAEPGASIYSGDPDTVPFVRPFENLADLPIDVSDAFEAFKLAIIRHKADDWQAIAREDMLGTLEALKELALAPASADQSSF